MKKKTLLSLAAASIFSLVLAGCSLDNPFGEESSASNQSSYTYPITANYTTTAANDRDSDYFSQVKNNTGMYAGPTKGNAKCLVVPINFAGESSIYTDTNVAGIALKEKLNTAFFGTSDSTDYWESLSSYYYKSSYSQLAISGTVTDYINLTQTYTYYENQIISDNSDCSTFTNQIVQAVLEELIENRGLNYSDYDSDGDGFIDYMWLVYTCPYNGNESTGLQWAYTYWFYSDSIQSKYDKAYNYSWASKDFMYEGLDRSNANGVDAHTYIHETGHQMGLDDYYSYDGSNARSPLGGTDMMDNNIVDHNSLSKFDLDWITPTVGEADKTYTLKPFEDSGESLIIANTTTYNGTPCDEFFICEYYTPTGLNKLDSTTKYSSILGLTDSGLRIMHVDQRLGKMIYSKTSGWSWDLNYYSKPTIDLANTSAYYNFISSNTKKYCYDSTDYALLSLVQASGKTNLMDPFTSSDGKAINADLFDMDSYVFGRDVVPATDSGWREPYVLTISAMNSSGITFTLTSR